MSDPWTKDLTGVDSANHSARHEDGGADEISIAALSGDPADTINESLLTTQNDIIVRGASIAERLAIGASRIVGRKSTGDIGALTGAEILAILSASAGATFDWNAQKLEGIGIIDGFVLSAFINAGGNNIINVNMLSGRAINAPLYIRGLRTAANAGWTLVIETLNSSDTNISRLVFSGGVDTAVAEWRNITLQGIVLSGALDANGQDLIKIGVAFLTEQAAAEADVTGEGQFWTKTDTPNYPMFTDDAGNDSPLLNVAYSSLWFHGPVVTLTVSTQNAFTKITQFVNTGEEDRYGNVVGDPTTDDDLTINLAGVYDLSLQASMTNAGGGPVEFNLGIMIILNTALTITNATNATPIVITSTAHGLKTGDGVVITGVGGNTAAIGDFTITRLSADTFSLQTLSHVDVVGNGAYTSGGTVDKIAPGNLILERIVSNTQMGRGALAGTYSLSVGDLVEGYAVNLDGTEDIKFEQIHIAVSLK